MLDSALVCVCVSVCSGEDGLQSSIQTPTGRWCLNDLRQACTIAKRPLDNAKLILLADGEELEAWPSSSSSSPWLPMAGTMQQLLPQSAAELTQSACSRHSLQRRPRATSPAGFPRPGSSPPRVAIKTGAVMPSKHGTKANLRIFACTFVCACVWGFC